MKTIRQLACTALVLLGWGAAAHATIIEYSLTSLGGQQWQYEYLVRNNTLTAPLTDFIVYFPELSGASYADYSGLTVTASPAGWSLTPYEPSEPQLGGYVEGFNSPGGIPVGGFQGGFRVSFTYLGGGSPASQSFEVYDDSFSLLDSGYTTPVPETSTWLAGVLTALAFGRRVLGNVCRQRQH